jgi:hypothetical protein
MAPRCKRQTHASKGDKFSFQLSGFRMEHEPDKDYGTKPTNVETLCTMHLGALRTTDRVTRLENTAGTEDHPLLKERRDSVEFAPLGIKADRQPQVYFPCLQTKCFASIGIVLKEIG